MIKTRRIGEGNIECVIDLDSVYSASELDKFNNRWGKFLESDADNASLFQRKENTIVYYHKSWIPTKKNGKPSVFMLFGNSASQSVGEDIYFAREKKNQVHRVWTVLGKLGYININLDHKTMKQDFFELNYESPFRLGFEVAFTFPSSSSQGVASLVSLFGKKGLDLMIASEIARLIPLIREFTKDGGAILVFQKDAFNFLAQDSYHIENAKNFELKSFFDNNIRVYGTPPTRLMYSDEMSNVLSKIRTEILDDHNKRKGQSS